MFKMNSASRMTAANISATSTEEVNSSKATAIVEHDIDMPPVPNVLYHATRLCHVESIINTGLLPRGERAANHPGILESIPDRVYLAHPKRAFEFGWINCFEHHRDPNLVMVEVDISGLDYMSFYPDEDTCLTAAKHHYRRFDLTLADVKDQIQYDDAWPWWLHMSLVIAYRGEIPSSAIRKIAMFPVDKRQNLKAVRMIEMSLKRQHWWGSESPEFDRLAAAMLGGKSKAKKFGLQGVKVLHSR